MRASWAPTPNPEAAAGLQAVVLCDGAGGDPRRIVGGITLLERILRQLCELDAISRILVLKSGAIPLPSPSSRVWKEITCRNVSRGSLWEMLREACAELDKNFIVVAADFLIDQRLLAWLAKQSGNVMLTTREGCAAEPIARLERSALKTGGSETASTRLVATASLPSYWESMHGEVPLHLYRVTNAYEAETGWRILLDHAQRRTLELPARYFDPPFENLIVRQLAGTPITANQVTFVTTLLGFGVAALYYAGYLRIGVLLAIVVEVLDGVDGKLARVTRTTSPAGEYEHILDFFYENSWYLALGLSLSRKVFAGGLTAALLMIGFDLTDNLAYSVLDLRWGLSLDNASPFLSRFRLIAGRRNIYSWLFVPGFFASVPAYVFCVTVVWAGITATVHITCAIAAMPALIRGRTVGECDQP
jgi:phosphatidylglycerophosphate synthase